MSGYVALRPALPGGVVTWFEEPAEKASSGALRNRSPLLAMPWGQPVCAEIQPLMVCHAGTRGQPRAGSCVRTPRRAGLPAGQVASAQASSRRVRPFPIRLRRLSAAVRRLSQAWFLAVPR